MAVRSSRRDVIAAVGLAGAGLAGGLALAAPAAAAPGRPQPRPSTPEEALHRLMQGNARFTSGHLRHVGQDGRSARGLAGAQNPFVIVLACSDSREVPELIFDEAIGSVFDQRVAGNIVDDALLGSMEFAVLEFAPPVLMVLGHQRCGAVTATVESLESGQPAPGHIGVIADAIAPVVEPVLGDDDPIESGVRANAQQSARQVVERSAIIADAVASGRMRVVAARYDLDDGQVTLLD